MKMNELASAAGVSRDTVRHYVQSGLLRAEKDPHNGYQLFAYKELNRLKFIIQAKQLGFKLNDIRQIFVDAEQGTSPCPTVREILSERIAESERKIMELQQLHARMKKALKQWRSLPNSMPNGDSVCELIESQRVNKGQK